MTEESVPGEFEAGRENELPSVSTNNNDVVIWSQSRKSLDAMNMPFICLVIESAGSPTYTLQHGPSRGTPWFDMASDSLSNNQNKIIYKGYCPTRYVRLKMTTTGHKVTMYRKASPITLEDIDVAIKGDDSGTTRDVAVDSSGHLQITDASPLDVSAATIEQSPVNGLETFDSVTVSKNGTSSKRDFKTSGLNRIKGAIYSADYEGELWADFYKSDSLTTKLGSEKIVDASGSVGSSSREVNDIFATTPYFQVYLKDTSGNSNTMTAVAHAVGA